MPSLSGYGHVSDPAEALAYRLLEKHGSDPAQASRPEHGWANEVWLGETAVARIKRAVHGAFAREVSLAAMLPPDVGYPNVLDLGVADGMEWMVTKRLPGENLKVAWPTLDASVRVKAATDLWARLEAVHRTDVAAARTLGCTSTPFYALDEGDARQLLDWLLQNEAIEPTLHDQLSDMLDRLFRAIPEVPTVLSHTDAGPHNTVWDGTNAIPIDFETASVAPADLDLECILRIMAEQGEPNPASALLEQAAGLLALPGAASRLWGYAVLRDLWGLRGWLLHARSGGDLQEWGAEPHDLRTWEPWRYLHGHASRTSWLADLL
ncbi:aminoglycoside phosphotransferase family protein [Actinopolymorpha sp. B9G3]|uniref:phosphotransferase family protein n=1 Tax=Actinopolymorpha sp. B9G3 TaxID=3158970 RepID=UPI0032D90981